MKRIYNTSILVFFLLNCITCQAYSGDKLFSVRLLESEMQIDDIFAIATPIDRTQYSMFAKDNTVYISSNHTILDNNDIDCKKMLCSSYSHSASSISSVNMFQINIKLNVAGKSKLATINTSSLGKKLAIVYDGLLIATPIVRSSLDDSGLSVDGLSYSDASRLDYALHILCAMASYVSFHLVISSNELQFRDQDSIIDRDESKYEYYTMGNRNYCIVKDAIVDINAFSKAKVLLAVQAPFTGNYVKEIGLEDIPWQFNEEEESARRVHSFMVKIDLNANGQNELARLSSNNAGQELATMFEGRLIYVERIPVKTNSTFVIVNGLTYNEAKRLADAINCSH